MIQKELLEILVCPVCKGELEHQTDPERLICQACRLSYPVRDDIPVMLADEAEKLDAAASESEEPTGGPGT